MGIRRAVIVWSFCALAASACVTPKAVREVSKKHGQNLAALEVAVNEYRRAVADYYGNLQARQREAYIAQMVNQDIDRIAADQFRSLPGGSDSTLLARFNSPAVLPSTLPDSASLDFISIGTSITNAFTFWGRNFDIWMNDYAGNTLEEKRAAIAAKAARLSTEVIELGKKSPSSERDLRLATLKRAVALLVREKDRPTEDLTAISVALDLGQQARLLDEKLARLQQQVQVMTVFHATIDAYVETDVTINGAAIAQALIQAATSVNPQEMPELKQLFEELLKEKQP